MDRIYSINILMVMLTLLSFNIDSHASENFDKEERLALITGASRGIGFSLVEELLKDGVRVIAVARQIESLRELEKQHKNLVAIMSADLSKAEDVLSIANFVGKRRVEYLVHNAGIIDPVGNDALLEAAPEAIQLIIQVNLTAPLLLTNLLSANLKAGSRVLMISSRAGDRASAGVGLYSVTKVALDRFAQSLQLDKPHGILAASVHPGDVDTDMQAELRSKDVGMFPRGKFYRENQKNLISPGKSARYLKWLLLATTDQYFTSQKHNIYDESHQTEWDLDRAE